MIKVSGLVKNFGAVSQIKVLKGMTIDFPEKGLVVLLGHSGSGKTTFLNVIGGLEQASSGSIEMFGKKIRLDHERTWQSIRSKDIGYIFQNYHLIPTLTVYDNVALSLRIMGYKDEQIIEQRVNYTLEAVKMIQFKNRLATQLSGGQQQRVAIARAIVKNPKVILADEPTGNLDSKNTYAVMSIIEKIAKETLVILVSHEKHLVRHFADRIIEVKDGEVKSDQMNEKTAWSFVDDNTLYLKDFNEDLIHQDDKWHLEVMSDDDEPKVPHHITMVVRNKTLYLDVSQGIKNIKMVRLDPALKLNRDMKASDVKPNEDIAFDLSRLTHTQIKNKHFLSMGKALKEAFLGLFNLSRKAKVMTTIFGLMGLVLAIGIPFMANVSSDRVIYTSDQPTLIHVNHFAANGPSYRLLESIKEPSDASYFINIYRTATLTFDIPSINDASEVSFMSDLGVVKHLSDDQLLYGKLPETPYEIVLDYAIVHEDMQDPISTFKQVGAWDPSMLIGKKIKNMYLPNRPFTIVGIVDTGAHRVYAFEEALVFLVGNDNSRYLSYEMFESDEAFVMTGRMPTPYNTSRDYYEILIPESMVGNYPGLREFDFENIPRGYEVDFKVYATGFYTYEEEAELDAMRIIPSADVSFRIFQLSIGSRPVSIVSANPERTTIAISALFPNAQVTWPYQEAYEEGRVFLLGLQSFLLIGVLLILIAIASVYFMMKTSMTSRIYEISVYRALGVSRFEIAKKHIADIFVTLTVSSVLIYVLTTWVVREVQIYLTGSANYFLVSTEGFLIGWGLIYLIGLFGFIPLIRLLKKTPAQILSQYDI